MPEISRRHLLVGAAGAAALAATPTASEAAEPAVTVKPSDRRYPELIVGNNQRWTASPAYVTLPTSTAQVVTAVQAAVDAGRRISVRSGGHCYEDFVYHPDAQAIIDLSEFREIGFDAKHSAVTIAPGTTLLEVYRTLFRRWGVTIPGGSCYSVGAGGHIVGGGYGFLSRKHGLIVDHLHGVEVVVVDSAGWARAEVATRGDDLWWAHTGGGGGNFGIVTRFLMRSPDATGTAPQTALPRPPATVLLLPTGFGWDQLDEDGLVRLVHNFGRWHEANSAPDSAATGLSALLALNHRTAGGHGLVVQVDGAQALLFDFLTALFDGLPLGAPPPGRWPWLHATSFLGTSVPALTDPLQRGAHKSAYLRKSLPEAAVRVLYRQLAADAPANPRAGAVLFSHGGQVNAVRSEASAVAQRDSVMKLLVQSFWSSPAEDAAHQGWLRDTYAGMFAGSGGVPADGCYVNYPDGDLTDDQWPHLYYQGNYPRLQRVKARFDPLNVFRHKQSVRLPS